MTPYLSIAAAMLAGLLAIVLAERHLSRLSNRSSARGNKQANRPALDDRGARIDRRRRGDRGADLHAVAEVGRWPAPALSIHALF